MTELLLQTHLDGDGNDDYEDAMRLMMMMKVTHEFIIFLG